MDEVVGGAVGGRLKVTSRGRPAVSAAARGPVAPAQRGVPCAAACRWLEPGLLCTGKLNVPKPETIGAMGDGPAATVAMFRAAWAAVVVRVCV